MKKLLIAGFALVCTDAFGAIDVFQGDLAGFNAAAGSPAIAVDFDTSAPGTNLAGTTLAGVTFSSPPGNTLDVVTAASTFTPAGFSNVIDPATNTLIATSGANVLSPGGAELVPGAVTAEEDTVAFDFAQPVSAFGIDVLFQSLDFNSFTTFQIFDVSMVQIASGNVDTGGVGGAGGSPGGTFFVGFVSDDSATHMARVVFNEFDSTADFPDSNIGFDTLRLTAVPLPLPWLLLGSGLLVAGRARRRRPS